MSILNSNQAKARLLADREVAPTARSDGHNLFHTQPNLLTSPALHGAFVIFRQIGSPVAACSSCSPSQNLFDNQQPPAEPLACERPLHVRI